MAMGRVLRGHKLWRHVFAQVCRLAGEQYERWGDHQFTQQRGWTSGTVYFFLLLFFKRNTRTSICFVAHLLQMICYRILGNSISHGESVQMSWHVWIVFGARVLASIAIYEIGRRSTGSAVWWCLVCKGWCLNTAYFLRLLMCCWL